MTDWIQQLRAAEQHLQNADPILSQLILQYGTCTIIPHSDYYQQLVKAIIGQQLSVKAAHTIYSRFIDLFGGVMPTPEQIMQTSVEDLRAIGCSYSKAAYIQDLALHITDGRLELEHLPNYSNQQIIEQLVAVKGIGEWSAHMFMMFSLGRLDVLPTGDLGIQKGMMQLFSLPALPTPSEMHTIARNRSWSPYESIASWYIWRSLDNAPSS